MPQYSRRDDLITQELQNQNDATDDFGLHFLRIQQDGVLLNSFLFYKFLDVERKNGLTTKIPILTSLKCNLLMLLIVKGELQDCTNEVSL